MSRSARLRLPCWLAVVGIAATIPGLTPSADAQSPAAKAAIRKGVAFLRTKIGSSGAGGEESLATYAMLAGGAKTTDPKIAAVVNGLARQLAKGRYPNATHGIYTAGVRLMLLEAAGGAKKYRKEMKVIVDFIAKNQANDGFWNYLDGSKHGDTSVTQYGILGLWAAQRAGIDVPPQAWDKTAIWLVRHQNKSGSFQYKPTEPSQGPSLSMTVAGVSTLLVARRYLFGDKRTPAKKKPRKKRTGDVEDVDLDREPSKRPKEKPGRPITYTPRIQLGQLQASVGRGMAWIAPRYRSGVDNTYYVLYGTERLAALTRSRFIGKVDWYADGSSFLLKRQRANGSWPPSANGEIPAAAFAVLFLSKATQKLIGEIPDLLGAGLLRGGLGLPSDLSTLEEGRGGVIKKRRVLGPIDELLEELKKPKNLDLPEIQKQIVEKIQLGDRKQWLAPKRRKQLLRMAVHPLPQVRKVAIWALGRTGNIDVVTVIMKALESDPDLGVLVEARNALCWLSRRPRGFGLPEQPEFPDGATKAQKRDIVNRWQQDAVSRWKTWYLTVRPYDERDDLAETGRKPE
ncbi:MAG: hypothetical protein ACE5KM_01170 [Planctomycetaceae bacterium]